MKAQTTSTSTSETTAQTELEAARSDVMSTERELAKIKVALKALKTAAASKPTTTPGGESTSDEKDGDAAVDADENTLKVYATKITGLAEDVKPTIHLQLSSPIESQTLTSLFDPLDLTKEGSTATFRGVESDVATLELRLEDTNKSPDGGNTLDDRDGMMGSSAAYSVIPMCEIDFLGGGVKRKVTELSVAIVSDDDVTVAGVVVSEAKKEEDIEAGENDDKTSRSDSVEEEDTEAKEDNNEKDEKTKKLDEGVDEDDVFEDAISKDDSTEKAVELDMVDAKVSEEDAVVVPDAAVVKEEVVKDIATGNDDEDAISKDDSTEKAAELDTVDAKVSEEDAVVVPDAAVDNEVVKDIATGNDDGISRPQEQEEANPSATTSTTSTTDEVEETTDSTITAVEEKGEEDKEAGNSTPEQTTEGKKEDDSKLHPSASTEATTTATTPPTTAVLLPTCTIDLRIEFSPSPRDEEAVLCDLLSKAMKKKAQAIDRLRKAAEVMNRSRQSTTNTTSTTMVTKSEAAVKAGFLNKSSKSSATNKEPIALVRWYRRVLGPQSLLRIAFPVAKNYLMFFGGIVLMHYQGYQLALPPPV